MCALAVIALGWYEYFSPSVQGTYPVRISDGANGPRIVRIVGTAHTTAGLAVGDAIDLSRLSFGDRRRLEVESAAPGAAIVVRINHAGRWSDRTLVAAIRPPDDIGNFAWPLTALTIGELIVGFIALRRPSIATAALIFAIANSISAGQAAAAFSWLPDPLFAIVAVLMLTTITTWPAIALIPFITRFPRTPATRAGRLAVRIGDALFWICGALSLVEALYEPVFLSSWSLANSIGAALITVLCCIFALLAILEARGEDRRRVGWVIAGYALSALFALAYTLIDNQYVIKGTINPLISVIYGAALGLQVVFPITLGYAVLRHRVLDIGFAINRTLVFGALTATIVIAVSFVDWLSGKLISESRLALALEAAVTVALGVALNSIHSRVEKLVDRFIFRSRYLAERRMHSAIEALAFATSERAIDTALTTEAAAILGLTCAAIYRRSASQETYQRYGAIHWPDDAAGFLDENSLLVRTIRSREQMFFIADLGVEEPALPSGEGAPVLAAPIATQHMLLGFALYGNEHGGASPDPEIIALLGRLCAAAATAYTNVEARVLRDQLAEYQRMLGPRAVGAE